MKKTVLALFFLLVFSAHLFAQCGDDFEDGNFSNAPAWTGDSSLFVVNPSGQLQSQGNSATETIYLSGPCDLGLNVSWQFFAQYDASPSNSNWMRFYLLANQSNLTEDLNGYYIQMGESGSADGIDLFRSTGGSTTKIIDGTPGTISSGIDVRVRVDRDNEGNWELWADLGSGFELQGSVMDNVHTTSAFWGPVVRHTSTRKDDFIFDDFTANVLVADTIPPVPLSVATGTNPRKINVAFSESLDPISLSSSSFLLSPEAGSINSSINPQNANEIILEISQPLLDQTTYTLQINGLTDLAGNVLSEGEITFHYREIKVAEWGDVIITEIFPDPEPSVGLPTEEYLEIFNRSDASFSLNNWEIFNGTTIGTLPNREILPGQYLILCNSRDTALFQPFGEVVSPDRWPSLVNGGDDLSLSNESGELIESVSYSSSWYGDDLKRSGGYSLERIDTDFVSCDLPANWSASVDPRGGTPGSVNSIDGSFSDDESPILLNVVVLDPTTIRLTFNESLDPSSLEETENYNIPGIGIPVTSLATGTDFTQTDLILGTDLEVGILYTLVYENIKDCAGNIGQGEKRFGIPQSVEKGDLILNEILFNPVSGGSDYLEIQNISDKVLDLQGIWIGNVDTKTGLFDRATPVSEESLQIIPGEILCLSENISSQITQYTPPDTARFFEVDDLPSFPDSEGGVIIFSTFDTLEVQNETLIIPGDSIDFFLYQDDYHFPTLRDLNGVSLERISSQAPTNFASSWHSAAATVNYGTPGYQNSQSVESIVPTSTVSLDNNVFTPNDDGDNDNLIIKYNFDFIGANARISVFDSQGRPIRIIQQNTLLNRGTGSFFWDGRDSKNTIADIGLYVIVLEVSNQQSGKKEAYKLACVLADQF